MKRTIVAVASVMPPRDARKVIAAREIIREMQSHSYDIVVLGRRATSPIGQTNLGSVTEKVLREAAGLSVWVID